MLIARTGCCKSAGRFTRHLNIISIDSFDNDTLSKIFCSITDWHFGSGFDPSFPRWPIRTHPHHRNRALVVFVF